MDIPPTTSTTTRREQARIKAKCFHPSGHFVEFSKRDVEQSIPQIFARIARTHPERLALKSGAVVYTYDALNKAANKLAHLLGRSGNESVAFLSDRTHGIVAILAILKAGKRYLALDPPTPLERNAFYLSDAGVDLLVTDNDHCGTAQALARDGQSISIINVDEPGPAKDSNPVVEISPDAPAGIFYTSGSTGEPKGVVQSHRNILHDVLIGVNDWHLCVEDRIAITESFSFSGAIRSVFPSLLVGAALFPYDLRGSTVTDFGHWVDRERITFVNIRRQLLGAFVALCGPSCTFSHLRWLQMGGELIYRSDIEAFQNHMPDSCAFAVKYSITEAGAIARYLVDTRSAADEAPCAPVGYPVDDTEICLVDDNGMAVANGEVGEIVVKSRYLSPGYWHRPDLSDRVFSPDPQNSQQRIYRTGDRGRFSPEGCLFHLGRIDSQVKVRGYRVEMTEVEHFLLGHPDVEQAVVKSFTLADGEVRLVGYIVPVQGKNPTVSELRNYLATGLADYMIPARFILMESFPMTASNKIDRKKMHG